MRVSPQRVTYTPAPMRLLPLREVHRAAGATLEETDGRQRVASHGDAATAALAARAGAGLIDLSDRGRLAVVGPDRTSWLHGMVTADVKRLSPGTGGPATLVTAKGKLVATARILVRAEEIWLDLDGARLVPALEQLRRFIVMEDCEVQDRSAETAMLGLHGPRAGEWIRTLAPALPDLDEDAQATLSIAGQGVVAIGSRRLGLPGIDLWLSPASCPAVWHALLQAGAVAMGNDAAEILRLESGRPRFGAELDEDTLPLEAGLDRAISYDKGCYLGQEVIARVTHRGHVNRKLAGLWLEGTVPASAGAALSHGGKPVGEVRSSLFSPHFRRPIALGYVRREQLAPGTVLALPDGRTATVTPLPFQESSP